MRYARIRRDEQERHNLQEYIFELEEVQDQAAELAIAHEQVKRLHLSCTTHGLCLVPNRTFVWCNRVYTEILGWETDELRGQSTEITYPDNHEYEKMGEVVYGNLEQQGLIIYEYDFVHKRGHRVPCLVSGRALDENKPSKGYIFSITDFTERKQAQEALQKAYDKLEGLNAELLLTNEQLNREIVERQAVEEKLHEYRDRLEDLVKKRTAALMMANRRLRQEITERHRTAGALREGERFLSSVFASIQDGLSILDLDYQIVQVNPTMEKWYAHARPLVGKKCYQACHGREHPCDPCPAPHTMATGAPHWGVVPKRGPRQEVVGWLEVHAYPRLDKATGKMTGVIEYVRDITPRRQAEEALEKSLRELRQSLEGTVAALANTVEMRDPYIAGHQRRVAQLACVLAQEMGFSPDQLEGIRVMGFLHDIGKIGIPTEILTKPGRLNEFEVNLVKTHAQTGYAILKDLEFPWPVAQAILQHHERLDGSGYPSGLSEREIISEAKILAVADVVEAMASYRPYRPAVGIDQALEEISRNRGTLYDPEVVDVCLRVFTEKGFKFDIDKQSFPDP